jgi:hypothetical protein
MRPRVCSDQTIATRDSGGAKSQRARVLASLERIGWRDRHEIPSLSRSENFAMEPSRTFGTLKRNLL